MKAKCRRMVSSLEFHGGGESCEEVMGLLLGCRFGRGFREGGGRSSLPRRDFL